jgi:hypothetical protein
VREARYMFHSAFAFQQNMCPSWARKLPEALNALEMFTETSCPNPYGPAAVLEFCFD